MRNNCTICNAKTSGKLFLTFSAHYKPLIVCSSCLNDYANHQYDELVEKIRKNLNIPKAV